MAKRVAFESVQSGKLGHECLIIFWLGMKENVPPLGSLAYWARQDATIDGVMGGFGHLDCIDVKDSKQFLRKVIVKLTKKHLRTPQWESVADLGAGVGRVTKEVLSHLPTATKFHIVEPVDHLIEAAKVNLQSLGNRITFSAVTLQDFHPPEAAYDVIWIQWALMYVDECSIVALLRRLRPALRPQGIIVVKDNVTEFEREKWVLSTVDESYIYTEDKWLDMFEEAGFCLVLGQRQKGFPEVSHSLCNLLD
eukprot:Protomagalhaensia_wolfi_Nauph_80__579@NODE_1328_length_1587_cov_34_045220_g1026_i0_p1_GENE_NODE_1328_length_1587_cov_34_045220_g1026_i0NODE_1328_length_1587_cov_34_045220_g1026_i0_p1_ORF_typecomplete_len251_score42_13Methyltransf_PK/PF05891_12/2_7e56Methyltransf_2/PF00891_18/6e15Methyltransf_25/PF13649_6/1_2e03Methyltransf_25/PF13649_6/2_5e13Methyltransf_23/PF13489_6/3_5e13Methyltransf_31/PF13847_6/1e10NodS/PF05401_11/6_5e10Ubie_methyltran/PF01209_18/1e08Methyltransf_11/PF08241_12/1_4e08Methyltr